MSERDQCSVDGCERAPVVALRFRGQPGHVHVCAEDEAIDREWCDVVASSTLPCTWHEDHEIGIHYNAQPTELSPSALSGSTSTEEDTPNEPTG